MLVGAFVVEHAWYEDGLRFRCTRCGNCCTGPPGFVWVNEEELAAIAEFRGESKEQTKAVYTRLDGRDRSLKEKANGDCVFYDRQAGCTRSPSAGIAGFLSIPERQLVHGPRASAAGLSNLLL